jgi:hypothetical protein
MLKKVLVLLAVLILFPVVAFGLGTNEYIGIDAPKPLFCGTGTVTVKGTVLVNQGNQFTIAKVYFARFGQTLQLMYSNNVPKDSQVHDWEFQAQIIQGVKYDIYATLQDASQTAGKTVLFRIQVPPCDEDQLGHLLDLVFDAYDRLP